MVAYFKSYLLNTIQKGDRLFPADPLVVVTDELPDLFFGHYLVHHIKGYIFRNYLIKD